MDEQTTIGKDFGGAVRYLFAGRRDQPSDKKAEILTSKGVNTNSVAEMIADFELGRDLNPRLNLAVWHTSLSFNPDDEARMSNDRMRAVAEDYLKKMGLDNTQYIVVRHRDRPDHHHLHIVANRVDNAGESIADGRNFFHSNEVLKELVKTHGLTPPGEPRLDLQHPERFRPKDLARYNLRGTLNPAVLQETQWPQLLATLKEEKIALMFHYNQAGKATGISFEKDGYCFKGSALGPHLSFTEIDKQLAANELKQRAGTHVPDVTAARSLLTMEDPIPAVETPPHSSATVTLAGIDEGRMEQASVGAGARHAVLETPSGAAGGEQSESIGQGAKAEPAEPADQFAQVLAASQRETNAIADYEPQARKADGDNELVRTSELTLKVIPAAKQPLAGRGLLAEQNDLQSGKIQKDEPVSADEGSAAAVPILQEQVSILPTVEPVVSMEVVMPFPVGLLSESSEPVAGAGPIPLAPTGADMSLPAAPTESRAPRTVELNECLPPAGSLTDAKAANPTNLILPTVPVLLPAMSSTEMLVSSVPEFPIAPAVAAPAVAWQYGTICLMDSKVRTSEERMSNVRAALSKAGAEVGTIVPTTLNQSASTSMPYRFDPKMPDLDKVTEVLNAVQGSGNNAVWEQVYNWNSSGKYSAADQINWPEREGQFNQAHILIQDATRGVARAEQVTIALQNAGAQVSVPMCTEDGQVTLSVYYHTYAPKINDINLALDQCRNSPNIKMQESLQNKDARYAGAVEIDARNEEKIKQITR